MINIKALNSKTNEIEIAVCQHRKCWNFRQMKKQYKKQVQQQSFFNDFIGDWNNTKHIHLKWLSLDAKYAMKFKKVILVLIKNKYL